MYETFSRREKINMRALHVFYGEFMGVRIARKHIGWYLQRHPGLATVRKTFNSLESAADQLELINHISHSQFEEALAA